MIAAPLGRVLEATGYLVDGQPAAPTVVLTGESSSQQNRLSFAPDVEWRSRSAHTIYFKYVAERPSKERIGKWQREVWNQGFTPLLWIVSSDHTDIYNGFGLPRPPDRAGENRLRTFRNIQTDLRQLDQVAGRLSMETGQFWRTESRVHRRNTVDRRLLGDISVLERDLVRAGLARDAAQALIGRSIFAKYLVDRKIVSNVLLREISGEANLTDVLRCTSSTKRFFDWLCTTFNGDMFPSSLSVPDASHSNRIAQFLEGADPNTGRRLLFPYQFDVIPVELISSIYEQFVHIATERNSTGVTDARHQGVYYTPLAVVRLTLDRLAAGLSGDETVVDFTCGSGVFLVEALRRLVAIKCREQIVTRDLIRTTLYEQIYGLDINESAIRVAAFSLYLAALELDEYPCPPEALTFQPLIGHSLRVGDAYSVTEQSARRTADTERKGKPFDLIVGNPPWSYQGKEGTEVRRARNTTRGLSPRGPSLDFLALARDFGQIGTRVGLVVSAAPFFSRSGTGLAAAQDGLEGLSDIELVDLSAHSRWLFSNAKMPAIVVLGTISDAESTKSEHMSLVHTPWSATAAKGHALEIVPADHNKLAFRSWKRNSNLLKVSFVGRRHDQLLLDSLHDAYPTLGRRLATLNTELAVGLTYGNRTRDATFLKGLPTLERGMLQRFSVPNDLLPFGEARAERPRTRNTYRAPLLLIQESLGAGGRPVAAISNRDVAFSKAYYGVSFMPHHIETAHLLCAVLNSAVASWYFLMSGSEFGVGKRRLLSSDVAEFPSPDFEEAIRSTNGRRVLRAATELTVDHIGGDGLTALDDAVFDLYGLDAVDRVVVRNGLVRAGWQWTKGREHSMEPADVDDIRAYVQAFLQLVEPWLTMSGQGHVCAEVYELERSCPIRAVRFIIAPGRRESRVSVYRPEQELKDLLDSIGRRASVQITNEIVGPRDVRVYGSGELVILKPASRRHWLGVMGLEDADHAIRHSIPLG